MTDIRETLQSIQVSSGDRAGQLERAVGHGLSHAVEHPRVVEALCQGQFFELWGNFHQFGVVEHLDTAGVEPSEDVVAVAGHEEPIDLDDLQLGHLFEVVEQTRQVVNICTPAYVVVHCFLGERDHLVLLHCRIVKDH